MRQQKHYTLNKKEVAKAKVILIFAVLGLILGRIDKQAQVSQANPATSYCTKIIADLMEPLTDEARKEIERRVNRARLKLTAEVKEISPAAAFLAILRYFESGKVRYRQGTNIAFTIQTMLENKPAVEHEFKGSQDDVRTFLHFFQKHVSKT